MPPTVSAGGGDGVAHAAVIQPASVAAVQLGELPRCVQLPDLGKHGAIFAAGLGGFLEVQVASDEVDPAWSGPVGKEEREIDQQLSQDPAGQGLQVCRTHLHPPHEGSKILVEIAGRRKAPPEERE